MRGSEGGGKGAGRERDGGRGTERHNIDRISVATDSIYPLLTGLLLGGFNFDSPCREDHRRDFCRHQYGVGPRFCR